MTIRNHNFCEQIENRCRCTCHEHAPGPEDCCPLCGCPKTDEGWKLYRKAHPDKVTKFKKATK